MPITVEVARLNQRAVSVALADSATVQQALDAAGISKGPRETLQINGAPVAASTHMRDRERVYVIPPTTDSELEDITCWRCWVELTKLDFHSIEALLYKETPSARILNILKEEDGCYECPRCGYKGWSAHKIYHPFAYLRKHNKLSCWKQDINSGLVKGG